MEHTLLDKIFIGFLFLFIALFGIITFFSTTAAKQSLINEKTETLERSISIVANQNELKHLNENFDINEMQNLVNNFSLALNADIFVLNNNGDFIINSIIDKALVPPKNIYNIDKNFSNTKSKNKAWDFYGLYNSSVITVIVPITKNDTKIGTLIANTNVSQLDSIQDNIFKIIYVPFLVMIILAFTLLGTISRKILSPIRKINTVAEQYSIGNFDTKINISTKDEIGQLAETLEFMASELSKLDDYRKTFISNISHDFRSPLTSIKGYVEAIKDGIIPYENQEKYLKIILDETLRLTKLTSGLIDLNNLDSYGPWLSLSDFDIITIIKKTFATFEGTCEKKNITLLLNNHSKNTMVHADKSKIHQVLYNLIDNAIKFTPEGKKITVSTIERAEKLFISVKDEGIGIDEISQKKIWIRFYKADISRGKDKQGTGLGLSIVKEIIKAHNENINLISTEGAGSDFSFSIAKSKAHTNTQET